MEDPNEFLPPTDQTNYRLEAFRWCQLIFLFANELSRQKIEWNEALSESKEVVGILQENEVVLAPAPWLAPQGYHGDLIWGYTDLVHWPSMVCAANVYASLPPGARQEARERMRQGVPPVYVLSDFTSRGCDKKVLADEEYLPAPSCLPTQAVQGAWIVVGTMTLTVSLLWSVDFLKSKLLTLRRK